MTRHPDSAEHRTMTSICINLHLTHSSFATAPKWLRGYSSCMHRPRYGSNTIWKTFQICLFGSILSSQGPHSVGLQVANICRQIIFLIDLICTHLPQQEFERPVILRRGCVSRFGCNSTTKDAHFKIRRRDNFKSRWPQSQKQAAAISKASGRSSNK